jgi:glycerate-2-kinase
MVTLVISDVLGDPLDLIASGPTLHGRSSPADAAAILNRYGAKDAGIAQSVFDALANRTIQPAGPVNCRVTNHVIGNNATAVEAAAREAERLGYTTRSVSAAKSEGPACEVGRHLAQATLDMRAASGPDCLVSGGEPTVRLVDPPKRGLGGRNQQLVLAAVERLKAEDTSGIVILSAGTDGEDGPTDAAGAWIDSDVMDAAARKHLDASDFLARNDAYHYFAALDALIKTGPTNTNVCDVRVVLVERDAAAK